jgi:hypothetical protein
MPVVVAAVLSSLGGCPRRPWLQAVTGNSDKGRVTADCGYDGYEKRVKILEMALILEVVPELGLYGGIADRSAQDRLQQRCVGMYVKVREGMASYTQSNCARHQQATCDTNWQAMQSNA